ncbi:hypothetical protein [Kribbella swartbergensis]
MDDVKPRRISRGTRYGVAAGMTLVVVPAWWLWLRSGVGGALEPVVLVGSAVWLIALSLLVGNLGIRPRMCGQHLEVTTIIGRQSLDLTALTGARWQRGRGGSVSLRLRDDLTDVVLVMPVPPQVFPRIKDGLSAVAARGVVLPRRVTPLFNLPAVPGAPLAGQDSRYVPVILAILAGSAVLGAVVGLLYRG